MFNFYATSCVNNLNENHENKAYCNIFQEQIEWAVEEGADYMIGETFNDFGEALLALESIQKYGKGSNIDNNFDLTYL